MSVNLENFHFQKIEDTMNTRNQQQKDCNKKSFLNTIT